MTDDFRLHLEPTTAPVPPTPTCTICGRVLSLKAAASVPIEVWTGLPPHAVKTLICQTCWHHPEPLVTPWPARLR